RLPLPPARLRVGDAAVPAVALLAPRRLVRGAHALARLRPRGGLRPSGAAEGARAAAPVGDGDLAELRGRRPRRRRVGPPRRARAPGQRRRRRRDRARHVAGPALPLGALARGRPALGEAGAGRDPPADAALPLALPPVGQAVRELARDRRPRRRHLVDRPVARRAGLAAPSLPGGVRRPAAGRARREAEAAGLLGPFARGRG